MFLSIGVGIGIAAFSSIIPFGNSISGVIMINIICNYLHVSAADTQCAIVSGTFGYMILSTLRDVADKEFSSEPEIIILNKNSPELWKSLEIPILQQIINIINVKIIGIVCGLGIIYCCITFIGMSKGSIGLTIIVVPFLLYKLYKDIQYTSFSKNISQSELLISSGIYLMYAPICLKIITSMSIAYPSVIVIYSLFLIPNLISNLISEYRRDKKQRLNRLKPIYI